MSSLSLIPVLPSEIGEEDIVVSEELVLLSELETGIFAEYTYGVHGVEILSTDRGATAALDVVLITNATYGSTTYASDVLLDPIPMMAKFVSTGGNSAMTHRWGTRTIPDTGDHYGEAYLYLDGAAPQNIRMFEWSKDGNLSCRLLLQASGQTIQMQNRLGTGVATTATVFAPGVFYRLEWHIIHATSGLFELKVYEGHETTAVEEISVTCDTRTEYFNGLYWGDTNGSNHAGIAWRIGALAEVGTDWFGPYTGPRGVHSVDGAIPWEYHSDGTILLLAAQDFAYDLGPSDPHAIIKRGTPVITLDPTRKGVIAGDTTLSFAAGGLLDGLQQVLMPTSQARTKNASMTSTSIADPADWTAIRVEIAAQTTPGNFGTGATTTAGQKAISISDYEFHMHDVGRHIEIDGTGYNVYTVTGPNSCELMTAPTASGTGLSWEINTYPKPQPADLHGVVQGSDIAQWRATGSAHAFVRKGTATCTTTAASPNVTITDFAGTADDIGRALLINGDPDLAPLLSNSSHFLIQAVTDPTHLVLDRNVPTSLAGVDWSLSKSTQEGFAINPQVNMGTLEQRLTGDIRFWDGASPPHYSGGMSLQWTQSKNGNLYTSQSGQDTTWAITGDGAVLAYDQTAGLGYGPGAGLSATQGAGSGKATAVTNHAVCGRITMNNAVLNAGITVSFVLTNSACAVGDVMIINHVSGGTIGAYVFNAAITAAGSATIYCTNRTAGNLTEAPVFQYVLIKGDT